MSHLSPQNIVLVCMCFNPVTPLSSIANIKPQPGQILIAAYLTLLFFFGFFFLIADVWEDNRASSRCWNEKVVIDYSHFPVSYLLCLERSKGTMGNLSPLNLNTSDLVLVQIIFVMSFLNLIKCILLYHSLFQCKLNQMAHQAPAYAVSLLRQQFPNPLNITANVKRTNMSSK